MSGRIPKTFIDDLIDRTDIVDLIGSYITLRKAGREHQARCPFHDEKTPSFTVSADKQFYHCFGCGAHGTAIGFLMEYCHLGFVEAVEELATRLGIEVPREGGDQPQREDHGPLYAVLEQAASLYRRQLALPQAEAARAYLQRRGLEATTIEAYGLGYAPAAWDTLGKALGQDPRGRQALATAGLTKRGDGGREYDRLRDRIVFPIRDGRGRVIGFGGRLLGDGTPKYLNSPETPTFSKGRELYGLYELRQRRRRIERIVVVEGYMDVLMLAQYGIDYAVATLGTATTPHHVNRLLRLCSRLVFCFDGDRAGREAAWKALQTILPLMREGLEIRFLFLPEGEDPDSFVREQGQAAFENRLGSARGLSDYFFDHLVETTSEPETIEGRAALAARAGKLLSTLPKGIFHEMMTRRLAELSRVEASVLDRHLGRPEEAERPARTPRARPRRHPQERPSLVRRAITLLLHDPSLADEVEGCAELADIDLPGIDLLVSLIELIGSTPDIAPAALVERWRGTPYEEPLASLLVSDLLIGDEEMRTEFRDAIRGLHRRRIDQQIQEISRKPTAQWDAEDHRRWQSLIESKRGLQSPDT